MTHFGADVTLLPSEPKPNFSTLAKVDIAKYKKKFHYLWEKFCHLNSLCNVFLFVQTLLSLKIAKHFPFKMAKIFHISNGQFFPDQLLLEQKKRLQINHDKKKTAKKGTIVYSCLHFPHNLTREVIRCSAVHYFKNYLNHRGLKLVLYAQTDIFEN